jgi:adenylate cyclase
VDGGFVAARAAIARFDDAPPVALRDLGPLAIRGRVDPVDAMALAEAVLEARGAAPAS